MSDPCKAEACAIQDCLKQWNYNESRCTKVIDQLYACCTKFYNDNGESARSPCCPTPSLLELKIKQRKQEQLDAQLVHKRR
ncbi:CYFA0S04e04236g1_1 [Cyberlindnera fabianii]|uniref:Cx9C motif-containing protein 4, mitochondrial n=1 Tax=Cyberlindnera fabianii TaxID=36022 RepID=A0A061ASI9_CYBFA|nr:Cx9C motif-containing protein 4, mitochondrial [Cyberlindnera fabianii]CDR40130.1 CYFA0S04e04236g1_1 [Cyberlindnera fabianii]